MVQHLPKEKTQCRKLVVNGASITDEEELYMLECWKNHFSDLVQTQTSETGDSGINKMEALSRGYEDFILDYDFTVDEIECALKHLKSNKSGGADGLDAEHLKFGGHIVVLWLKRILNGIIQLERIWSRRRCESCMQQH